MNGDIIAAVAIVIIIGLAIIYIIREKRRGTRCIGCPHAGSCSGRCSGDKPSLDESSDENKN